MGVAAASLAGIVGWVSLSDPGSIAGSSLEVVETLAEGLLEEAGDAPIVLLGEDHRSPLPDAIGAAMLRREAFDCVALELHQELQPAVDQYAKGQAWDRTVWPLVRNAFGVEPLALGQDKQVVRTARKQDVYLAAVDRFPRGLMRTVRAQRRSGASPSMELRQTVINDRDAEMAAALQELLASERCHRVLYTVGYLHVLGLERALTEAGVGVHATVVDHAAVPPLPDPLAVRWEDGRITVE